MTDTITHVDTEVWVPDPDRPGFLKFEGPRTVGAVYADLRAAVGPEGPGHNEYFTVAMGGDGYSKHDQPWPQGRTVVFATTGGSEGHYVHAGVMADGGQYDGVLLAKTFDGFDAAWEFARRLAQLLGV